jgi:hypothetical protein
MRAYDDPVLVTQETTCELHHQLKFARGRCLNAVVFIAKCLEGSSVNLPSLWIGLPIVHPESREAFALQEVVEMQNMWIRIRDLLADFPRFDARIDGVKAAPHTNIQAVPCLLIMEVLHLAE